MATRNRFTGDGRHEHRRHRRHSRDQQDGSPHDDMAPVDRRSSGSCSVSKHRESHDRDRYRRSTTDTARHSRTLNDRQSISSHDHDVNMARSDSSDEILIKHRASRRLARNSEGDDIARQIKNIEKAQREALRPESLQSQEIHIHYMPIVTRSASPPLMDHDDHRPLSSAATDPQPSGVPARKSLARGLSAGDVKIQLKDLTMSLFTKRSSQQTTCGRQSSSAPRRSKNERRDKHGKVKCSPPSSSSKYLAPLAQRWVCYKCGKVRSDSIQRRYPLHGSQKMQPNWCGKCRVNGELKGRPLDWNGQRHYCWGCGIVRSERYHDENRVAAGETSTPNYCKRCRELSPSFERNLRETSELGSEHDLLDQALRRQMYDASLSDVDEDDDHETSNASGKENEDPNNPRKMKATQSFILKHGASSTKPYSDSSLSSTSESGVPVDLLKAMHLDADRAHGQSRFRSEHFRLSGESYQPPSVESLTGADDDVVEMKDACGKTVSYGVVHAPTQESCSDRGERRASANKACQTVPDHQTTMSSSTRYRVSAAEPVAAAASANKKKVHWIQESSADISATAAHSFTGSASQPYHSDSGFSSSACRSVVSLRSAGSVRGRLRRLHPSEYSTGSPPPRESTSVPASNKVHGDGLSRVGSHLHSRDHAAAAAGLPSSQGTCGNVMEGFPGLGQGSLLSSTPTFAAKATLAGHVDATSNNNNNIPTPPEPHNQPHNAKPAGTTHLGYICHDDNDDDRLEEHNHSPNYDVPNFSRAYHSPQREEHRNHHTASASASAAKGHGARRPDDIRPSPPPQYMTGASLSLSDYDDSQAWAMPMPVPMPMPGLFAPPAAEATAFDFSALAAGAPDVKFVRRRKKIPTAAPGLIPAPCRPQWYLYEDETATSCDWYNAGGSEQHQQQDDEEEQERNYQWRDGRTTIHRSRSGGPSEQARRHRAGSETETCSQPRNMVTILSIREMGSDDEDLMDEDAKDSLHYDDEDMSNASDLATVMPDRTPSSIC